MRLVSTTNRANNFTSRPTEFCQLTEARQWLSADPHATARLRIEPWPASDDRAQPSNQLGRQIVQRLGYQVDTADGYQKFCENCLTLSCRPPGTMATTHKK